MRSTISRKLAHIIGSAVLALLIALSSSGAAFAEEDPELDPGGGGYGWVYRNLQAVNNAGVSGTLALADKGDGTTTVVITLQGSMWGRGSIHDGQPDDYNTEPTFQLNDVVDGKSTTVIAISLKELQSIERTVVVRDMLGGDLCTGST